MVARKEEPSQTAFAVLGLLSFDHELSGYDLKKWADGSLKYFYWSPAISQIYSELKRLQELDYVTSRIVVQDEVRNKRVYKITDAGLAALTAWVEDAPVEPPVLKHSPMLRLWLGHLAEPDQLRSIAKQHREHASTMAEEASQHVEGAAERDMPMPKAVLQWAERYYEREVECADQMLAEIDRLEGER